MIQQIEIKNFQSHKQTVLNLSAGVNLIIGKSDSGKTAILRALNWLINNKPAGDSFRSSWGGTTQVDIVTAEDDMIQRIKSDKESIYAAGEDTFKAFGQGVPDEISKLLNISSLNIQYQMDSPFLLSESSGEVARYFNRIVNLEAIDESLKKAHSKLTSTGQEITFNEKELEKEQQKFDSYEWVLKAEKEFDPLYDQSKKVEEIKEVYEELQNCISIITNAQKSLSEINFTAAEKELATIEKQQQEIEAAEKQLFKFSELIKSIQQLNNKLSTVNFEAAITGIDSLLHMDTEYKQQYKQYKKLEEIILSAEVLIQQHQVKQEEIETIELFLKDNMPDICPLCGSEMWHG